MGQMQKARLSDSLSPVGAVCTMGEKRFLTCFSIRAANSSSSLTVSGAMLFSSRAGFISGWASMACAIFFMGGVQLLCLGVIGEYIGKIYNETKARPRYIISETTFDHQKSEDN